MKLIYFVLTSRIVATLQAWVGHDPAQKAPSLSVNSGKPLQVDVFICSKCLDRTP